MKRHKDLFTSLCSFENLLAAARKAQRGKRMTPAVAAFNFELERELLTLRDEIETQTYTPGPCRVFTVVDAKPRRISAAPYRDRVVHHALCNIMEPIFERAFIHDSYACRKGKGTHAAADRLTQWMQTSEYVLQCDIRKYFASVDHAILKETVRRKIACARTLWLVDRIIDFGKGPEERCDYFGGDDLFSPFERLGGLPIGNQTSQFFANVYLDPLDQFIKEQLHRRRYVRNVDDFVKLTRPVTHPTFGSLSKRSNHTESRC